MALEITQARPLHHRPGPRPPRLLPSRHPAIAARMDRYSLARRQPAGRQRRRATRCSKPCSWGRRSEFTATPLVAVCGAEMPPKVDGVEQPGWTRVPGQGRAGALLRLPQGGRARLYRRGRRHRRAGGARLALDLSARRARRLRGPAAEGRRPSCRSARQARRQSPAAASPPELRRGPRQGRRSCACCRGSTGIASPRRPAAASSTTPGRSRRRPTASAIASAAAGRWSSCRASSPSARAPTRPTSSTAAIPTGRSRCRAARSRSCCTATPSRAAATSCSAR